MQKYTLVKLLEDKRDGYEFTAATWPLHVTLVDDFFVDLSALELRERLKSLLASQRSVKTTAQDDDFFGPSKDIRVSLVETTPELQSLHNKLVSLLKDCGTVFVSPEFAEDGFRPHVTVQDKNRVHKGDEVTVDTITIIDMQHGGDPARRKLLSTIVLGLQ